MVLTADFFRQGVLKLARELLGKLIVREVNGQELVARIVETEAYKGPEDKACHAYQNRRTSRTETMFKAGGCAYVYLVYGIHHCFNVVAGRIDHPEAVLIRAGEPLSGLGQMKKNRNIKSNRPEDLTNGPGKLCQAMEIDKTFDGIDLINGERLYITAPKKEKDLTIEKDTRINIDYAEEYKDKPWRFYIKGSAFISS